MIHFFRTIRKKLAAENKVLAYLRYAIGEILLVVIGILIALQVNNWNEKRKAKINEKELYTRIIIDLKNDKNRINKHIDYYKNDLEVLNSIYQETKGFLNKASFIDFSTVRASQIFALVITSNYSKSNKEISNQKIEKSLKQYFRLEQHVKAAFEMMGNLKEDQVKPYLAKYGINNTKELFNNRQLDYYKLREKNIFSYPKLKEQYGTAELDQLLFDIGIRTSWAKTALENLLEINKKLQLDLTNELGDNKSFKKNTN